MHLRAAGVVRAGCGVALAALLGACSPVQPGQILLGRVDPDRIAAYEPAASTGDCALRRRASLPVGLPGLPVVQARINGQPATLILDTGAESTILTATAAKRLGVTTKYDFVRTMNGIGGTVTTGDAKLASMALGGVALSYPRALVANLAFRLGAVEADGLLGASVLGDFDLDLDVPHRRVDLYDRVDCEQARPAWGGRYATLTTTRSLSEHPFFPITVNGRAMSATLDTGAQRTVISARAAAAAGIGTEHPIAGPPLSARGAAGEVLPATLHAMDVTVAGMRLSGPVIVTAAGLPRDIDALLGLDFLLAHRVWLSYGARRIFIQAE